MPWEFGEEEEVAFPYDETMMTWEWEGGVAFDSVMDTISTSAGSSLPSGARITLFINNLARGQMVVDHIVVCSRARDVFSYFVAPLVLLPPPHPDSVLSICSLRSALGRGKKKMRCWPTRSIRVALLSRGGPCHNRRTPLLRDLRSPSKNHASYSRRVP